MSCDDCQDHLIDFAHRELDEPTHRTVASHLAQCADCALEYCRLQADMQGIASAHTDDAPSSHVAAALREKVAAAVAPSFGRRALSSLRRPVPMYGALLAASVPLAMWFAAWLAMAPGDSAHPTNPPAPRLGDPAITHYDASRVPDAHRDVL
jgi:anti-sigma factor RsiW